jgi:hypothetical protein
MGHLYPEKTPCGCLAMYFPTTSSRPNVALTAPNCATYNAPSMSTDSSEADAACHTSVVCMDNRAAPACAPLLPTPVGMNGDGTVEWKRWTSMGQTRSPEPRGPLTTLTQPSATPPTLTAPRDRAEQTLPLPPSGGRQAAVAPRNLLWRCVKWPLRKLLLGAYLAGDAIRRRPLAALAVGALALAALITSTAVIVATRTPATPTVTVAQPALPPLPASVLRYLRARQRFDAVGMWATYDATGRSNLKISQSQLQATLDQQRKAGLTITRYVYSGGFRAPDGTTRASIEVYTTEHGHASVTTWYFVVGTDGLIQRQMELT